MTAIVERIARQIDPDAFKQPVEPMRCDEARRMAAVALRGLRKPTKAMIRAGCLWVRSPEAQAKLRGLKGKERAIVKMKHRWEAMIDEALTT